MPHIHDKIDFTVEVFIVHKNKVLLRMHDKFKIWLSVGGHIELDEDPVEAAVREVKEEVGLDVKIIGNVEPTPEETFRPIFTPKYLGRHRVNDTHEHIFFVYFATTENNMVSVALNEHEQCETRWVNKEELETMDLIPNVKFYAVEALKALGEK